MLRINSHPEVFLHLLMGERDTGRYVGTKKGWVGVTPNDVRSHGARAMIVFDCTRMPQGKCYLRLFGD